MDVMSPENCFVKECMKETRKRKIEVEEDEVRKKFFLSFKRGGEGEKFILVFHISLRFHQGEGEVYGEVEEDGEGGEKVVQSSL